MKNQNPFRYFKTSAEIIRLQWLAVVALNAIKHGERVTFRKAA